MKGRKPKDGAMRLLSGNAGNRAIKESSGSDLFMREPVVKPGGLNERESQEWDRLTSTLAPILFNASAGLLRVVGQAFSQMMEADAIIQAKGLTYEPFWRIWAVIRQRPEVRIRDAARMAYFRARVELGGSPVSIVLVR